MNAPRVNVDPDHAARDLVSLVLTLVELLRQLMERQAIRRIDEGGLTEDQEEALGTALMMLDRTMTELCEHHGLSRSDLGLDLGPLGPLLADTEW
ncbi:gas vesicle protein K [Actinacidiphila rubida]|uniref:Gas vesicle protein K n=1 Tax=Actinacidiphila rubida TaxID=310780 RepID=A0A1H8TKF5_9ACTN|nr:gas vesicle protein K [Actinacidiphila rubida]SEO91034.1 Gas vesicle protein K [Actinacidiphila rubida]